MSEFALEIAKKKYVALKRAERRLMNRFGDIDWEYNELRPAIKELEAAATEGKLPTFELTDGTR